MIKRTLYFGNPTYLHMKDKQLVVRLPEVVNNDQLPNVIKREGITKIPIEDIGFVILDHKQITLTQGLLEEMLANNVAVITCDSSHHPIGMMLPLATHTLQNERFRDQIDASEPLKKQLWQQTITKKIQNQARLLTSLGINSAYLNPLAQNVKSGDTDNCEATAAVFFWQNIFGHINGFVRYREGPLPTLGIHHANKYNAYCLADDLMEPYRPFVDKIVYDVVAENGIDADIPRHVKVALLSIPAIDVNLAGEKSPLMIATQRTAFSLVKCFSGETKKLLYPDFML